MIPGSYVPNLVNSGPYITSQSCPQTPDGRTDGRTDGRLRDFIFCAMHMHCTGQTIKSFGKIIQKMLQNKKTTGRQSQT